MNRVENPGTARWTSQDPLGFGAGDADLYRYVRTHNDPTVRRDPSGLGDSGPNGEHSDAWTRDGIPHREPKSGPEERRMETLRSKRKFRRTSTPWRVVSGCNGGLFKIPNYSTVTITGFYPDGSPRYIVEYRSWKSNFRPGPEWFPAQGGHNPWGKQIPGCDIHQAKTPEWGWGPPGHI